MALPPKWIIGSVKWGWHQLWQVMMQQLAPHDAAGNYLRPASVFRQFIGADVPSLYPPAPDRYRLIVGYGCPWAHRSLIVRALKGLEACVQIDLVIPSPNQGVWQFSPPLENARTLPDFYQYLHPGYDGRSTVPVLWDTVTQSIVNNESADIMVMLNSALDAFALNPSLDLYPAALIPQIDHWSNQIYQSVNNGVYRCGFAQNQASYDRACAELFDVLDTIEAVLATQRYLCGDRLTLADIQLFTTLFRFDSVYYSLFKCNRRRIQDYRHLSGYARAIYQLPGVAQTCHLSEVQQDYYGNLFPLNPGGIIPSPPDMGYWSLPPDRE